MLLKLTTSIAILLCFPIKSGRIPISIKSGFIVIRSLRLPFIIVFLNCSFASASFKIEVRPSFVGGENHGFFKKLVDIK